jgi:hypothetical protein
LRNIDLSSWHSLLMTLVGLAFITLVGVGVRLLMMMTIQQRRERLNRQINERLRTLIAAYRTLGGSFTGNLAVDPRHLRDTRRQGDVSGGETTEGGSASATGSDGSDRARRIRDATEAALSDIILLGTEEQVRLAARAAQELIAGKPVHTHELVVSLRNFVREALDLASIPPDLEIPMQGPSRPSSNSRGKADRGDDEMRRGGSAKSGGAGMGGGAAVGGGIGLGVGGAIDDPTDRDHHG